MNVLTSPEVHNACSEHIFQGLNSMLTLAIDALETLVVGVYDALRLEQVVSPDLKGKYNYTPILNRSTQPSPRPDASQYTTKSSGLSGRARIGALHNYPSRSKIGMPQLPVPTPNQVLLFESKMSLECHPRALSVDGIRTEGLS
ncbi:hypothetical protein Tco_0585443 [Tanacetum coccineum]